jgi:hypothetical protein
MDLRSRTHTHTHTHTHCIFGIRIFFPVESLFFSMEILLQAHVNIYPEVKEKLPRVQEPCPVAYIGGAERR